MKSASGKRRMLKKASASPNKYADRPGHLRAHYRLIELPLLLRGRECSQSELTDLYEVDRKTLKTDLTIIAEYWPIREEKRGRYVYYSIDANAEPKLRRIGAAKRARPYNGCQARVVGKRMPEELRREIERADAEALELVKELQRLNKSGEKGLAVRLRRRSLKSKWFARVKRAAALRKLLAERGDSED